MDSERRCRPQSRSATKQGRRPAVRTTAIGVTCLVVGSVLSGCCTCNPVHSPVAYSDGNPYEASGDLWGIGYYCREFGFLRRADPYCRDVPFRAPSTYNAYAPP